jgi:hypothetical protein
MQRQARCYDAVKRPIGYQENQHEISSLLSMSSLIDWSFNAG